MAGRMEVAVNAFESKEEKKFSDAPTDYIESHSFPHSPDTRNIPLLTRDLYQFWSIAPLPHIEKKIATHKALVGAHATINKASPDTEIKLEPVFKEISLRTYHYIFSAEMAAAKLFADAIRENHFRALANLSIISLLIEQTCLDINRIKYISEKGFTHWNFDHTFYSLRHGRYSHPKIQLNISKAALENPLLPANYVTPYRWLYTHWDERSGTYTPTLTPELSALVNHPDFLREKHLTMLIIILTPAAILKKMTSEYKDACMTTCFNILQGRKIDLERNALLMRPFRQFLFKDALRTHTKTSTSEVEIFLQFLEQHTSGNGREVEEKCLHLSSAEKMLVYVLQNNELFRTCKEKQLIITELVDDAIHHAMANPKILEETILNDSRIEIEFKKEMIQKIVLHNIEKANTIDDLNTIIRNLEGERYHPIKERTGFTSYSFWGYTHKGEPVSKTFSNLMGAIKKRMAAIPTTPEELEPHKSFIESHRMHSIWTETATATSLHGKLYAEKKEGEEEFVDVDLTSPTV